MVEVFPDELQFATALFVGGLLNQADAFADLLHFKQELFVH